MRVVLLAWALLGATQDDLPKRVQDLVGKLRSETPLEREEAMKQLRSLGPRAIPELEKFVRDPDADVADRVRRLVRILPVLDRLTPNLLRSFPDAPDRLTSGAGGAWIALFVAATELHGRGERDHPELKPEDIAPLVPPAAKEARTRVEKWSLCQRSYEWHLGSAIPEIERFMKDEDASVRGAAAHAYIELGGKEKAPVIALLRDPSPEVREKVLLGLAGAGVREAAVEILPLLQSKERTDRTYACYALGTLRARQAIPDLLPLVRRDEEALGSAIQALGLLRAREAAPEIQKHLGHPEDFVRSAAAKAMGELGRREAVPDLIPLLKDPHNFARAFAALSLGELGARDRIPDLVALLSDPDGEVRCNAARALGEVGSVESVPLLIPLLKADHRGVREDTVVALGLLRAKDALSEVSRCLEDRSPRVKGVAAEALVRLEATSEIDRLKTLMAKEGDGWMRSNFGAALAALGSREGARPAIDGGGSLHGLNALRRPEAWKRLEKPLAHDLEGSGRALIEALALEAGLRLEVREARGDPERDWAVMPQTVRCRGGITRLRDAIGECLPSDLFGFVLEADLLRVLSRSDAVGVWKAWVLEQGIR
jgi:HEAT repeat protein